MKEHLSLKYKNKKRLKKYDIEWIKYDNTFYDNGFCSVFDEVFRCKNVYMSICVYYDEKILSNALSIRSDGKLYYKVLFNKKQKILCITNIYLSNHITWISSRDGKPMYIKFTDRGWNKINKFYQDFTNENYDYIGEFNNVVYKYIPYPGLNRDYIMFLCGSYMAGVMLRGVVDLFLKVNF